MDGRSSEPVRNHALTGRQASNRAGDQGAAARRSLVVDLVHRCSHVATRGSAVRGPHRVADCLASLTSTTAPSRSPPPTGLARHDLVRPCRRRRHHHFDSIALSGHSPEWFDRPAAPATATDRARAARVTFDDPRRCFEQLGVLSAVRPSAGSASSEDNGRASSQPTAERVPGVDLPRRWPSPWRLRRHLHDDHVCARTPRPGLHFRPRSAAMLSKITGSCRAHGRSASSS